MSSFAVCTSVVLMCVEIVQVFGFPRPVSDLRFIGDKEIVDGPRELYIPLPLRRSSAMTQPPSDTGKSDLMIYGKLYLLRNVQDANKDDGSRDAAGPLSFRSFQPTIDQSAVKKGYSDGISFPDSSVTVKRSYQYSRGRNPSIQNSDASGDQPSKYSIHHRKLEERSAENQDRLIETIDGSKSEDSLIFHEAGDEEGQDLLREHSHNSRSEIDANSHRPNTGKIVSSLFNRTSENHPEDYEDRFLIDVPAKMPCPKNEKPNHRGKCARVVNPYPKSSFDYRSSPPHPNMPSRNERTSSMQAFQNAYLQRLLRSVAELEKKSKESLRAVEDSLTKLVDANTTRQPRVDSNVTVEGSKQS